MKGCPISIHLPTHVPQLSWVHKSLNWLTLATPHLEGKEMVATKLLSFCCCRQQWWLTNCFPKLLSLCCSHMSIFRAFCSHNVLQLDLLAPSCTLTLMLMLPHKVQENFCVFENWRVPQYPSLLENWGVILHLLLKSKREFKLGSSNYFKKNYIEKPSLRWIFKPQ